MGIDFSLNNDVAKVLGMKRYLLLRDNQERGPYAFEEIIKENLKPSDLIWVEGNSNSWKYPIEIEELKQFVQETKTRPIKDVKSSVEYNNSDNQPKRVVVTLPPHFQKGEQSYSKTSSDLEEAPVLETKYVQSLDEIKEMYVEHLKDKKYDLGKKVKPFKGLWLVGLFTCLLLSAFLIKKMIDAFDENMLTKTNISSTSNSSEERKAFYQNALTTEVVPVDTSATTPAKKTSKKVNVKKLVSIKANNYQVGMFGGINNLKFSVYNKSDHVLDKVTIEVDYLKPNGESIRTKNYYITTVEPKSSKSLDVPSSNRGVKIKYRIIKIKSHPYQATMVET